MSDLYTILKISEEFKIPINRIYEVITQTNIRLDEKGMISSESLNKIREALGIPVQEPKKTEKKPKEKPSRRHNPSGIHQYINHEEQNAFFELMEDVGEDMTNVPESSVFGGLAVLLGNGIFDRRYPGDTIESVVSDFYPLGFVDDNGTHHKTPDNIWFVEGAEMYRNWDDETKQQVRKLSRETGNNHLEFTYNMRELDSDTAISASTFLLTVEDKKFIHSKTLERFKLLANGLLLYKNLGTELKQKIVEVYRDNHERIVEFAYQLFSENFFEQMQKKVDKNILDDNSYLAAIMFTLKDENPKFRLTLGNLQNFDRQYGGFRKMEGFKEKGKSFYIALGKIKGDIDSAKKNKKIDVDQFIANTLEKGTYQFFYDRYSGRGIQYSTFIAYSAAAFFLDSKRIPEHREYGKILSKLVKERRVEKVDRLRGKNGKTILVDLCREASSSADLYQNLEKNWKIYRGELHEQGCWKGKPRKDPFSQTEVNGMYELVQKFPDLFK